MPDGRLLLQIKDAPFDRPVLSRFASDGTLKLLTYLIVLYDPDPPQFIGIEEPENFLHNRRRILSMLPEYRLSKFQRVLPDAWQVEMVGDYLLDFGGAEGLLRPPGFRRR